MRILTLMIFAALTLAACATNGSDMNLDDVPFEARDTSEGRVLANDEGMTVYTFGQDEPGQSNCYGGCAEAWPPVEASSGATASGKFSIIERDDGSRQWAYDGEPLYLWVQDSEPGDATGHNVNDVWFVVPVESSAGASGGSSGLY